MDREFRSLETLFPFFGNGETLNHSWRDLKGLNYSRPDKNMDCDPILQTKNSHHPPDPDNQAKPETMGMPPGSLS